MAAKCGKCHQEGGHTLWCPDKPPTVGGKELDGSKRDSKQYPRGDEAERAKEQGF